MNATEKTERIRVPKTIDRPASFLFLPGEYLITWVFIAVGCMTICFCLSYVVAVPFYLGQAMTVTLCTAHLVLFGTEPWKFGGRFLQPKNWVRGYPTVELGKPKLVAQSKRQRVGRGKQRRALDPIEKDFHLVCTVEVALRGMVAGGYLLQKGERLRVVWSFDCQAFPTNSDRVDEIVEVLREGLRDLPTKESYTVRAGSFSSDRARQAELEMQETGPAPEPIRFLVRCLRSRTRRLRKAGRFNPKFVHIESTYTLEESHAAAKDSIERLLYSGYKLWQTYTGKRKAAAAFELEKVLRAAYDEGFLTSLEFLRTKLGLTVRPRSEAEIVEFDRWRLNGDGGPPLRPQCLRLDRNGLHWDEGDGLHTLTALFAAGAPKADKQWVYLPGRKKFCGGVCFARGPAGWRDKRDQFLSGAALLNHPDTRDTEIIVQLRPDNQKQALDEAEQRTKGSNSARRDAKDRDKINVGANRSTTENVEIEDLFYDGEVLTRYGWMCVVYRSTVEELDADLNRITAFYRQPARLEREVEYFDRLWAQAQPWSWELLLKAPFERRKRLFSVHLPGVIPWSFDRTADREGICLIGKQGNTPLYVNPCGDRPQHCGLLGATGSGKSILAGGMLLDALARGFDVTIIDSTRGDGSGTFDAFTDFVGGAYFNTVKESNNLFETGDLQGVADPEEREAKELMYRKVQLTSLLTIVTDRSLPAGKRRQYRSLLGLGLKTFYDRADIQQRYAAAYKGGFGSGRWQEMPTIRDFEPHLTPAGLGILLEELTGEQENALKEIRLELRAAIDGPLGRTIAQPSTFDTNSRLVVYALGGANEEQDIGPLVLSAYSHAIRRSFSKPRTFLFLDEASELIGNYPTIAEVIAAIYSKGRKSGISACYSGQDLHSIAKVEQATQILQNTTNYFIGRIKSAAVKEIAELLEIPPALLRQNTLDSFSLPASECATPWLLKADSVLAHGDYYPSREQLALLVNEPEFVERRQEVFARYPNDPYRAAAETAKLLSCRI